ncbi:MAG: hypothetical protein IJ615_11675 [Bacteroidaceae bacterium]|nr:hypothetical protein [Bacteroidaceae bacterium]
MDKRKKASRVICGALFSCVFATLVALVALVALLDELLEMSGNTTTIIFLLNFLRAKFVKNTYIPTQTMFTH